MRFFIPGFLGLPLDSIKAHTLWEWGERFNAYASRFDSPRTLIGYSLGGRKALHALLLAPHLWDEVSLRSTHPGLVSNDEKRVRTAQDLVWAKRFLNDPWNDLMKDWEAQPVFNGSHRPVRDEQDYDRRQLAFELTAYSLGAQDDLREKIASLNHPIEWVVGELDGKFTKLAQEIAQIHSRSFVRILPGIGHRPETFT